MQQRLIEVDWNPDAREWIVRSRPTDQDAWDQDIAPEDRLGVALDNAWVTVTGG